ncbi:HEAT repeat domain-containing protein [Candidatus Palauibacter irciniicola]|uniref:HEAT repeat domain-containing protein n=1 Tax=Candidatus Palauibacter irciniicola TaxID=3056733 RepID=UPI003B019C6D
MNFLKALFGPSRKDVWRQLADEVDGQFHEVGLFNPFAVQARTGDWTVTLDTYTSGDGKTNQTFTRLRAPYFNPEGFRFDIYRAGVFSGFGKALGLQDIEVGHPRFDRDFVIKGNAPRRLRRLFGNGRVRRLMQAQPKIQLTVKGRDGWFGRYPDGMDELHFQAHGAIKDLARLRNLFDLFTEVLWEVCHGGRAHEDDVPFHVRRLGAPGGRITNKYVLWEGDRPRRDAAAALGRLEDPAAIPALADVLWDEDAVLRLRAVEALAEIRHPGAIGPLVPLLGDARKGAGLQFRDGVAEALRQLGEGELVVTVGAALGGDFGRLKTYDGGYRAEIIAALGHALEGSSGAHAANALAEIHAVEALPRLRAVQRSLGTRDATGQAVAAAIGKLEARASLPRAAAAADVEVDTLPRSAQAPGPDPGTLPRGSQAP